MTLSNLPPGVSDRDIPGNTAEDAAFDALYDQIALSGLTADEAKRRWDSQPDLLAAARMLYASVASSSAELDADDVAALNATESAFAKAQGR